MYNFADLGVQCNITITDEHRHMDEVCEREMSTKAMIDSEPEADGETTEGETTEDEKQDTGGEDFHCEEGIESESEDNTETR